MLNFLGSNSSLSNELYNTEAEQYLLAAMVRYPEEYLAINAVGLSASDFVNTDNRKVAEAIFSVVGQKKDPTLPLIIEALKAAGHESSSH
jgi:replicative DNA helicase